MTLEQFLKDSDQTAAAFAMKIGAPPSTVTRWLRGERRVSPEMAIKIEAATNGKIRRHLLRPDLWPSKERAA